MKQVVPGTYTEIRGLPNNSQRGSTPSPGLEDAAMRPSFLWGAPDASLTVT